MSDVVVRDAVMLDLTWFLSWPTRTGIQRYMYEITKNWPNDHQLIPVIVDETSQLQAISFEIFRVIDAFFDCGSKEEEYMLSEKIKSFYAKRIYLVPNAALGEAAGLLLPETTYNWGQVWYYLQMIKMYPAKIFVLTHDFIPWLSPDHFPHLRTDQYGVTGYLRLLRRCANLGFVSTKIKDVFEARILRGTVANPIVLGGGSEAFEPVVRRQPLGQAEFVFIGTVQLRKQHFLVCDVFQELWSEGCCSRLTFVGSAGNISAVENERMRSLSKTQEFFCWEEEAADAEVREILGGATATLYPSTEEGLGLPFLESLRVGVPAIISRDLPALEFAPQGGFLAIDVSHESLKQAIKSFLEPDFAEVKRLEIDRPNLPTWRDVTQRLVAWIFESRGRHETDPLREPPVYRLADRFRFAQLIHGADQYEGAAFVRACFRMLFCREPTGAETIAWKETWDENSYRKLDLITLMATSESFLQNRPISESQKWLAGGMFYENRPEVEFGYHFEKRVQDLLAKPDLPLLQDARVLLEIGGEKFIENCYHLLLGRSIDDNGRAHYSRKRPLLNLISERRNIIREIIFSDENVSRMESANIEQLSDFIMLDQYNKTHRTFYVAYRKLNLSRVLLRRLLDLDGVEFSYFAQRLLLSRQPADINLNTPTDIGDITAKAKYLSSIIGEREKNTLPKRIADWVASIGEAPAEMSVAATIPPVSVGSVAGGVAVATFQPRSPGTIGRGSSGEAPLPVEHRDLGIG